MKKITAIILFLLICLSVFAQARESEFYVRTINLLKVYQTNLGYRVTYSKDALSVGVTYLPLNWFYGAASSGQLIQRADLAEPYMSVFWKNGEFHHVKLYVPSDPRHESWGQLPPGTDLADRFEVTEVILEFY